MSRLATIPESLKTGPFTLDEALSAGLTRRQLQSSCWRHLRRGFYIWRGAPLRPDDQLAALNLPPRGAFAGRTSCWLHTLPAPPCDPIEVIVQDGSGAASRLGVSVRRLDLDDDEIVNRRGFPCTSLPRTFADLAGRIGIVETVLLCDMALNRRLVEPEDLTGWIASHPKRKGVRGLHRVASLADAGAESPGESQIRLLLELGGLPRPLSQVNLYDEHGGHIARVDLYYPKARVVIEYDGQGHRDRMNEDLKRQNRLVEAGYVVLRFTAADLQSNPERIVALVRSALLAR